jgi:hypothetical protein
VNEPPAPYKSTIAEHYRRKGWSVPEVEQRLLELKALEHRAINNKGKNTCTCTTLAV